MRERTATEKVFQEREERRCNQRMKNCSLVRDHWVSSHRRGNFGGKTARGGYGSSPPGRRSPTARGSCAYRNMGACRSTTSRSLWCGRRSWRQAITTRIPPSKERPPIGRSAWVNVWLNTPPGAISALYWLLGTSVRENGPLSCHCQPLSLGQVGLGQRSRRG